MSATATVTLGPTQYQVVVGAVSRSPMGFEALARPVVAGRAIPPLEVFGSGADPCLLRRLDQEARLAALREARGVLHGRSLMLNLAPVTLAWDWSWLDEVVVIASLNGIAASQLVIELTEHGPVEPALLRELRTRTAEHGIALAVDDLGDGVSRIAALSGLRPDLVKLAGWAAAAVVDDDLRALVANAVRLCHGTGASVVAEMVETEEQARALAEVGVDLLQGYAVGRPCAAELIPLQRPSSAA